MFIYLPSYDSHSKIQIYIPTNSCQEINVDGVRFSDPPVAQIAPGGRKARPENPGAQVDFPLPYFPSFG